MSQSQKLRGANLITYAALEARGGGRVRLEDIAIQTGYAVSTIQRSIKILCRRKLITKRRGYGPQANFYLITRLQ